MSKGTRRTLLHTAAAAALAVSLSLPGAASAAAKSSASVIPVRDTAVKIGAKVTWNQKTQTVTLTKKSTTLVMTAGKKTAKLNGKPVTLSDTLRVVRNQALISPDAVIKWFKESPVAPAPPAESGLPGDSFIQSLQSGDSAKAQKLMSPAFQLSLTAPQLKGLWKGYAQIYGTPGAQLSRTVTPNGVHTNITYSFQTASTPLNYTLRLNKEGLVDDLFIGPASTAAYTHPSYVNPSAYTEEEVTIGEGIFAVPGVLTKPAAGGPAPVVVLVHGSGPQDRDSSIGGSKPFRDLANGLASQGIAVLRYDKITYEHTFKFAANPRATIKQETVDDAISAVRYLSTRQDIDRSHIFVAGHSQGGFALPLILNADKDERNIRGSIMLAGPSSSFVDVVLEQQKELILRVKSLGGDPAPYEKNAEIWMAAAKMLNDPQYSQDNLPSSFPLGSSSAYWWYTLKDYQPAAVAKNQKGPLLILAGENDWQVPMSQFSAWKSELKNRTDVEFKSYPKVNHLLSEYDALSTGAEYAQAAHVAEPMVNDIAAWVKNNSKN
ncbi:alpha/beta fold hydrolase [Paenibacillus sp. YPG26]|uniref:alpha/beta fold hydrolase n=1 Tax=Paenibacillus sp. YPG26 TaxID=2878915 RepID=UPI002040D038|nr:alpha/beta fold hydrolase [Paenibacillus sp. YPG26]USB33834.1 alpha/beta fold hydrolase [Paenibacillus sp. YPG26]